MLFIPSRKRYAKTWVGSPAEPSEASHRPAAKAAGQPLSWGGLCRRRAFFRLHSRHTGLYA